LLRHSVLELVHDACKENHWNSTHFTWIDICDRGLFSDFHGIFEKLFMLSGCDKLSYQFFIPGCWDKLDAKKYDYILHSTYWRFCGSFFLADSNSISQFYNLYKMNIESFIKINKVLTWDFNFWALLEATTDWKPIWYNATHNDSLVHIPTQYYAKKLVCKIEKKYYDYPAIEGYFPSNTCYLCHLGKHILNIRYINYSYFPNGTYNIRHPNGTIITKNITSILNNNLIPIQFNEMNEKEIGFPSYNMYSVGLEDIRLYSFQNKIKYIATNVNYIGNNSNRMIIGDYDIDTHSYKNSKIIQPPTNTNCEKNWIPIIYNDVEYFIYKWSPFQIGKINTQTDTLEIVETYEIRSPDFHRIRGSSIFIEHNGVMLGVVHYCEETRPRQYYHMLVTLDKNTLKPISYSVPFCFQHYGVEFCIGFTVNTDQQKYTFWVTKKDNDTVMISINMCDISIDNHVSYII
jgi:hypothetical protein